MIQLGTRLRILDNTGALHGECIKILGKTKMVKPGDMIVVALKSVRVGKKVRRGMVFRCLVVRTGKIVRRMDGGTMRFVGNGGVLVDRRGALLGNKIRGPIAEEIREKNYLRKITLSFGLV